MNQYGRCERGLYNVVRITATQQGPVVSQTGCERDLYNTVRITATQQGPVVSQTVAVRGICTTLSGLQPHSKALL